MALRSMTGFGRARRAGARASVEAEVRAVNGRFLSVKCRLPSDLSHLEPRIEALVRGAVERGSVDVWLRLALARRPLPRIDARALAVYRRELARLGGGDPVALLALPGVVSLGDEMPAAAALERVALAAVRAALAQAVRARQAEGARLAQALQRETAAMARELSAIEKAVPGVVRRHHEALRRRLSKLLGEGALAPDDPLLRREVAVLADKGDFGEELDRLRSHLQGVRQAMAAQEPAGRRMDFLFQEMGREINTLGAKCNDAGVVARVIALKSAMERLREQAANIE